MSRQAATRQAIAIRHVQFEDLGIFERTLREAGYAVSYREAGLDDLGAAQLVQANLLFVFGGPIGVYQDSIYPFLADELRLLERRLAVGLPTIGICLGVQLMAWALGSRVFPSGVRELGTRAGQDFVPIHLTHRCAPCGAVER